LGAGKPTSVEQAVAFARISDARRLVMFHHDPDHDDEHLEILLSRALCGVGQ
jgi:phosphoribosyl 1,2-cyclic phosphodiesterase